MKGPQISVSPAVQAAGTEALFDVLSRHFIPQDIVFAVYVAMRQAEILEEQDANHPAGIHVRPTYF